MDMRGTNKLLATAILGLLTVAAPASPHQAISDEDERQMAGTFIRCAAAYKVMAGLMDADDKPSAAEHLRGLGRGAEAAALWIYSVNYAEKNPEEPKPLGAWSEFVKPQIDTEGVRFMGLMEFGDFAPIKEQMEICTKVNEIQTEIVQKIRDSNRPQP